MSELDKAIETWENDECYLICPQCNSTILQLFVFQSMSDDLWTYEVFMDDSDDNCVKTHGGYASREAAQSAAMEAAEQVRKERGI